MTGLWAKHQTVSDPEHVAAAKVLRRDRIGLLHPAAQTPAAQLEVEIRCLADYDTALGLHEGGDQSEGEVAAS